MLKIGTLYQPPFSVPGLFPNFNGVPCIIQALALNFAPAANNCYDVVCTLKIKANLTRDFSNPIVVPNVAFKGGQALVVLPAPLDVMEYMASSGMITVAIMLRGRGGSPNLSNLCVQAETYPEFMSPATSPGFLFRPGETSNKFGLADDTVELICRPSTALTAAQVAVGPVYNLADNYVWSFGGVTSSMTPTHTYQGMSLNNGGLLVDSIPLTLPIDGISTSAESIAVHMYWYATTDPAYNINKTISVATWVLTSP